MRVLRNATIAFVGCLTLCALGGRAAAEPATRVVLNGVPSPVYFNDGDSFRVLAGKLSGTKGRTAGFNTLESYGPVHQWGGWTARELYVLAKMGTLNARRGEWSCTSDMSTDTYGRTLWWCRDLAIDQVRKGLAHTLTITDEPARPELLEAQWEAQAKGAGIWAHGMPSYVITSTHALGERPGHSTASNRRVSSVDGHSRMWEHTEVYDDCRRVCTTPPTPEERRADLLAMLRKRPTLKAFEAAYDDERLFVLMMRFVGEEKLGPIDSKAPESSAGLVDEAHREPLRRVLSTWKAAGVFKLLDEDIPSCMTHIHWKRRFGGARAACLK